MKIAYLLYQFPKLSETFIIHEAYDGLEAGLDVRIISVTRPSNVVETPEVARLVQRTTYIDPAPRRTRLLRTATTMAWDVLSGRGRAALESLRIDRYGHMAKRLLAAEMAHRWPRIDDGFDVIHCHFGPMGECGALLKTAGLTGARIAITFHGYDMSSRLRASGRRAYRHTIRTADALLPVSEAWRRALLDLGAPPDRVIVQHMGVDCSRLVFQPRRLADGEAVRFLSIGRMIEKKGHMSTLRAFASLLSQLEGPQPRLDIIGDGPLFDEARRMVRAAGLFGQVGLHGAVPHAKVLELLDAAHVFVLASMTAADGDMEGIPVSLMEAMAMGLPVLATRHSGVPELVEHGRSGLLAPEGDERTLTAHMAEMVRAPERWEAFGRYGRQTIERAFNRALLAPRLARIYAALAAGRPPAEAVA